MAGGAIPIFRRTLTPRERMVAELVAHGRSNREIAQTLGISVNTVKTHVTNMMMKWNCARTEVAVEAVRRLGLEDDNGPDAVD